MIDIMIRDWKSFLIGTVGYWLYPLGVATFLACQYLGLLLFRRWMKRWVILRTLLACLTSLLVWMTGIGIMDIVTDNMVVRTLSIAPVQRESLQDLAEKVKPAVVTIVTYDEKGEPLALGSGFFTSPMGHVMTNRHVLEDASRATVETSDGSRFEIRRMLAEDKKADLVEVVVDSSVMDCRSKRSLMSVAGTLPEAGDRVLVVGNPKGLERSVSEGIVSAVRSIGDYGDVIQISAPVSPGSSGSPVLNLNGEVIGVATFIRRDGQNLNFAVSADHFRGMHPLTGESLAVWAECNLREQDGVAVELSKRGEFKKALHFYEEATRKTPENPVGWYRLGYCHAQLGHQGQAIEAYQKAISLDPKRERVHYDLGQAYFNLREYREAVEAYKEEIRHNPRDFEARTQLCDSLNRLGFYQQGVQVCRQALRLKPEYKRARYNLGVAYLKLGQRELAMDQYWELRDRNDELAKQLIHRIVPGYSEEDDLMNPVIRRQK